MLGNQISGKGGGVQGVLTVVYMYVYLISYISNSKETQACPPSFSKLSSLILPKLYTDSVLLTNEYHPSETFSFKSYDSSGPSKSRPLRIG